MKSSLVDTNPKLGDLMNTACYHGREMMRSLVKIRILDHKSKAQPNWQSHWVHPGPECRLIRSVGLALYRIGLEGIL